MGPDFITEYLQDTEAWLIGTFCATALYGMFYLLFTRYMLVLCIFKVDVEAHESPSNLGVLAVLYTQSIVALCTQRKKSRWTYFYAALATIMFGIGTINIVAAISMY